VSLAPLEGKAAGFDDAGARVPVVGFDFDALDAVETDQDDRRDLLRAALGLVFSSAPQSQAIARLAALLGLLRPEMRPCDLLHHYPGLRRGDLTEAKLELASLLVPDEKKTPGVCAPEVSQKIEHLTQEGPDVG
jgi:hypothetical protein